MGATLKNLGFKRRWALLVILFISVFPDFDYIPYLLKDYKSLMLYHRSITHSALAMFIVPVFVSFFACVYETGKHPFKKHFSYYWSLGFMAYAGHLFLDLQNKFGVTFFAPMDWMFVSTSSLFYTDPFIMLAFIVALVYGYKKRRKAKRAVIIALVIVCVYCGLRVGIKSYATEFARQEMDTMMVRSVTPHSYSITNWWYVAYNPDGSKVTGVLDIDSQKVFTLAKYPSDAEGRFVRLAKDTDAVKIFYRFAQHPHVSLYKAKGANVAVSFKELLYSHMKKDRFRVTVTFSSKGKLLSTEVKY